MLKLTLGHGKTAKTCKVTSSNQLLCKVEEAKYPQFMALNYVSGFTCHSVGIQRIDSGTYTVHTATISIVDGKPASTQDSRTVYKTIDRLLDEVYNSIDKILS